MDTIVQLEVYCQHHVLQEPIIQTLEVHHPQHVQAVLQACTAVIMAHQIITLRTDVHQATFALVGQIVHTQ